MTELYCEALGLQGEFYWDGVKIGTASTPFSSETLRFDAGSPGEHELVIAVNNNFVSAPATAITRSARLFLRCATLWAFWFGKNLWAGAIICTSSLINCKMFIFFLL
jgi:hypothetical protein